MGNIISSPMHKLPQVPHHGEANEARPADLGGTIYSSPSRLIQKLYLGRRENRVTASWWGVKSIRLKLACVTWGRSALHPAAVAAGNAAAGENCNR